MVSTATTRNRFNKQGTGDNTNTWGTKLNGEVFDLIDEALDGYVAVTVSGNVTLTSTNYVTDQARMRQLWLSGDGGYTVTIPGVQKFYLVRNACSAAVTFTAGGVTCSVPASQSRLVFTNGTDCYVSDDGASLAYVNATFLPLAGGTMTGALTLNAAPTVDLHASTKKYVDDTAFTANAGILPGQGGNSGKYLTTNGTTASWGTVDLTPYLTSATAASTYQPLDSDLTAIAALTTTSFGRAFLALAGTPTQGTVIYYNGSSWDLLGPGTAGQFLQTQGAGANPVWAQPAGGGMTTKPLQLPKWLDDAADIADGVQASTAAAFWTAVAANGSAVDTDFTATTWKSILSVTGAGEMANIISPTLANTSDTVEFEITVNGGTPVTFIFTATGSAQRAVMGGARLNNPSTQAALGSMGQNSAEQVINAGAVIGSYDVQLLAPAVMRSEGWTRLRFDTALLVRMRTSQNITATANHERQSGVTWISD